MAKKKVKLADVLWEAANERLTPPTGLVFGTDQYSCNAAMWAEMPLTYVNAGYLDQLREQQNRNKGNVVQLTFRGETKSRAEWSREVGIGETTIAARMQLGWSVERALTTPPNPKHQPRHARAGSTSHG